MSWFDNLKKWFQGDLKEVKPETSDVVTPSTTDEVLEKASKKKVPKKRTTTKKTGTKSKKTKTKKESSK